MLGSGSAAVGVQGAQLSVRSVPLVWTRPLATEWWESMIQAIISGHLSFQGRLPPWAVGAALGDGRGSDLRDHLERLAVLYELKRFAGDPGCTNELVELGDNGFAEFALSPSRAVGLYCIHGDPASRQRHDCRKLFRGNLCMTHRLP